MYVKLCCRVLRVCCDVVAGDVERSAVQVLRQCCKGVAPQCCKEKG